MNLCIAFVADPLENFDTHSETTFFLMAEACKRSWVCWHLELKDLFVHGSKVFGRVKEISVACKQGKFSYKILKQKESDLSEVDAIFLRRDPPVDLNFIDHLSLLELIADKTLCINDPSAIKFANEKIYPLHFGRFSPPTLIAKDKKLILDFARAHKTVVFKPLNLSGGRGVIKVAVHDSSLLSLIDTWTESGERYIMVQRFIPEAARGDKRILLFNGEILGTFKRVPARSDFRGNLHSGAKLKPCTLNNKDREIVEFVKHDLAKRKLIFVGLDIIGNYLTEINVTSPMGIGEINRLENTYVEKKIINWVEAQCT